LIGLLLENSANQNQAFIHTSVNSIVDVDKQRQQKVKTANLSLWNAINSINFWRRLNQTILAEPQLLQLNKCYILMAFYLFSSKYEWCHRFKNHTFQIIRYHDKIIGVFLYQSIHVFIDSSLCPLSIYFQKYENIYCPHQKAIIV
jgi:hypothetical protein